MSHSIISISDNGQMLVNFQNYPFNHLQVTVIKVPILMIKFNLSLKRKHNLNNILPS